jgi:hypothetical protein
MQPMKPEDSNNISKDSHGSSNSIEGPYRPSWIDRFNQWVESLPISVWVFHLLLGMGLILIHVFFLWLDDSLLSEEIFPIIIFNSLAIPYLLIFIYLLDKQAVNALDTMRSVFDMPQQEFADYEYRLSTMPFLAPLVAGSLIVMTTILLPTVTIPPERYAVLEKLPTFIVVFHILDKSSAFLFGVLILHTIRQLRMVNKINKNITRINLFNLGPLLAFSRLTGSTAIGLLIFIYPWMLINPELLFDPILFANVAVYSLIAIIVFVWPLWGVHRIIDQEKRRTVHEIDQRFQSVLSKFSQHIDNGDYDAADKLNGAINSLEIQHKRFTAIPTWPWKSETARLVLTAVALPLMLMILQYFILQALD